MVGIFLPHNFFASELLVAAVACTRRLMKSCVAEWRIVLFSEVYLDHRESAIAFDSTSKHCRAAGMAE